MSLIRKPWYRSPGMRFSGYDIPPTEVAELYKLYTQTNGPSWTNKTNWFQNKTCATWYGLTVAGGRVTQISFSGNGLTGTWVPKLSNFSGLKNLYLEHQQTLTFKLTITDLPSTFERISFYNSNDTITAEGTLSDFPASTTFIFLVQPIYGGNTPIKALAVGEISLSNITSTTAQKDSVIERIYADRALFTNAAHDLKISTGQPLTGTYQAANPPTTPAEKAFALVNDHLGEGFPKWTIML